MRWAAIRPARAAAGSRPSPAAAFGTSWNGGFPRHGVVELGSNDWLGYVPLGRWRPTPLERFSADYARLLDRLTEAGAVPVCLGIWGPADGGAEVDGRAEGGAELAAYDDAISDACQRRGGAFIALSPVYETPGSRGPAGRRTPWGISDTTHPNDLGHQMIADLVLAACGRL